MSASCRGRFRAALRSRFKDSSLSLSPAAFPSPPCFPPAAAPCTSSSFPHSCASFHPCFPPSCHSAAVSPPSTGQPALPLTCCLACPSWPAFWGFLSYSGLPRPPLFSGFAQGPPAGASTSSGLSPSVSAPLSLSLSLSEPSAACVVAARFAPPSRFSSLTRAGHRPSAAALSGPEAAARLRRLAFPEETPYVVEGISSNAQGLEPRGGSPVSFLGAKDTSDASRLSPSAGGSPASPPVSEAQVAALLSRCLADRHSLQGEDVLSLLQTTLRLRVSSRQLLCALAEELEFRLIRPLSLDSLCAVLSAYSFFFPGSIHLSAARRSPEPPPQVSRMLALLKREMAARLEQRSRKRQSTQERGSGHSAGETPTQREQGGAAACASEGARTRGGRRSVEARGEVPSHAAKRSSLEAALAALARLGSGKQSAGTLAAELQRELCELMDIDRLAFAETEGAQRLPSSDEKRTQAEGGAAPPETPRASAPSTSPVPRPNPRARPPSGLSTRVVTSASFGASSSRVCASTAVSASAAPQRAAEPAAVLRERGALAAALATLRTASPGLVRRLVEDVSAALDRLGGRVEAERPFAAPAHILASSAATSATSAASPAQAVPEREGRDAKEDTKETMQIAARSLQAVLKLCSENGYRAEPLRASLWRLEEPSQALGQSLSPAELLRLLSALCEEDVKKSVLRSWSDAAESQQLCTGVEDDAARSRASQPELLEGPFVLFTLRALPSLAAASDDAFDELSPRGLLLLLALLPKLNRDLQVRARWAAPGSSESSLPRALDATAGARLPAPLTSAFAPVASAARLPQGEQEEEACEGLDERVEETLQEFGEALARAAVAKAADCTPADLLLGLAAVEQLERHRSGLFFSGARWRSTPSFSFVADCFLRSLLRRWKAARGKPLLPNASQRARLADLLTQLGLREKAGALLDALTDARGSAESGARASRSRSAPRGRAHDRREDDAASDDDEGAAEEASRGKADCDRRPLGLRTEVAVSDEQRRRNLGLLDRSSLPFLDEDFTRPGLSQASRGALRREATAKRGGARTDTEEARAAKGEEARTAAEEGDDEAEEGAWESPFRAARMLVRDRDEEGRVLSLLGESLVAGVEPPGMRKSARFPSTDAFSAAADAALSPPGRPARSGIAAKEARPFAPDSFFSCDAEDREEEGEFSFRSSSFLFADEGSEAFQTSSTATKGGRAGASQQAIAETRSLVDQAGASSQNASTKGHGPNSQRKGHQWWEASAENAGERGKGRAE
ncbi:hypothetical protein BESB_061320 [Besnoitia besnoiti]|uniref:Uncharacterized protein n=1 Tax=Besnoitia besnoiti TaxID=94643 RepID=A0A2A9MB87_BESBE|nr:hypothetical protein BESB_061320 [Besnoitia besnoiti]PFH35245.1 hypothetical protein BESB_061320 [Besnoitia besnoiti]